MKPNSGAIGAAIWATWASECVREVAGIRQRQRRPLLDLVGRAAEMVVPRRPDAHGPPRVGEVGTRSIVPR